MARSAAHSHDSARSPVTLARGGASWPQFFRLAALFAALLVVSVVLTTLLVGFGRSDAAEAPPSGSEPSPDGTSAEPSPAPAPAPDLAHLLPLGPERDQSVERQLLVLLMSDMPAQVEQECRELLSSQPDHPLLWLILGESLERQARWRDAFGAYGQALALDADLAPAHARRGRLFCRFRQFEEARQECEKALSFDPDDPLAHAYLGIACAWLGERETARGHALRAEAAGLNMSDVWKKLAE